MTQLLAPSLRASRGEVARAALFAAGIVGLYGAVVAKLVTLQVHGDEQSLAMVERRTLREQHEAAPRGRVLDRYGRVLAEDLPVFEVRAEAYFVLEPAAAASTELHRDASAMAADLAACLLPEGEPRAREELRDKLLARMAGAVKPQTDKPIRTADRKPRVRRKLDFLLADDLRSAAAMSALADLDDARRWPTLHFHVKTHYDRSYPGGDACIGPVGFVAQRDTDHELRLRLEAVDALRGGVAGTQSLRVGARKQRFWNGPETPAQPAHSVITTLDLDLQKAAHAELERLVADLQTPEHGRPAGKGPPAWAALVIAEVATGDVLAMASYVNGVHPRAAAFTPLQSQFEPGSSVKPLVFAIGLRRGVIDWEGDHIDCSEGAPGRGWRIEVPVPGMKRSSRPITDDHACGVLTPHEILTQSSNVGAVKLGLRLGAEGLEDYVTTFRYGERTALGLLGEAKGVCGRNLQKLSQRDLYYYTGASYCFGYQMMVTPVQMLRAYLSLLSRRPRELRLIRGSEIDGRQYAAAAAPVGEPFLSEDDLALLKAAMASVVSETPGATGRDVAKMLRELGVAPGIVAGKTGTSVFLRPDGTRNRTASFAGFAPVDAPRYVAFCVLQKDRTEGLYGGRYAAPPAVRLILHALGVLTPNAGGGEAARARQVRAAAPVQRVVASAQEQTGR